MLFVASDQTNFEQRPQRGTRTIDEQRPIGFARRQTDTRSRINQQLRRGNHD
jgi:hypothetical protein